MTIFAVVAIDNQEYVDALVPMQFVDRCFKIGAGHWLVYGTSTAKEIAERVGWGATYEGRSGIVYAVSGYFGIANTQAWAWLNLNWARVDA